MSTQANITIPQVSLNTNVIMGFEMTIIIKLIILNFWRLPKTTLLHLNFCQDLRVDNSEAIVYLAEQRS